MVKSKNSVIRLSKYKNALYRFKTLGFVRVFSDNLADAVGVAASQVRKDFSIFGVSGNRRGGYLIDELLIALNHILGKDKVQKIIIVGVGHIGSALINYQGFSKEGIKVVAGFDVDAAKHNLKFDVPIMPMEKLKEFVKKNNIDIAIIAVPDIAAQDVLDAMVSAGIKGVLNFAPIRLHTPANCVITNVNLGLELETLIYFTSILKKERSQDEKSL